MIKAKKFNQKALEKFQEDFYDDDFEEFDYGTGIDNDEILVTPSASVTSTAVSVTPETDSAGNNLNSKGSNFQRLDFDLMSSLESDYTYEDEEDSNRSQSYDFHLFHEALHEIPATKQKRYKNGTRTSLTFSNQRVREIERHNQILLSKIMKSGPSTDIFESQKITDKNNQRATITSAAVVNRRKKQEKIDYENQLLKRKIEKIAARRA